MPLLLSWGTSAPVTKIRSCVPSVTYLQKDALYVEASSESLCGWNWAFASWGFLKCPWGKFGLWWVSDPFPRLWSVDGLLRFLQSPLAWT